MACSQPGRWQRIDSALSMCVARPSISADVPPASCTVATARFIYPSFRGDRSRCTLGSPPKDLARPWTHLRSCNCALTAMMVRSTKPGGNDSGALPLHSCHARAKSSNKLAAVEVGCSNRIPCRTCPRTLSEMRSSFVSPFGMTSRSFIGTARVHA